MKKFVFLLFASLLVFHIGATDMEDKKLTLSFDIAGGTDSREFGFSQERIGSPDDVPVNVEKITLIDNTIDDGEAVSSNTVYVYWKVLSSEEFELELSGSPLTREEGPVSEDETLTTVHYGSSWTTKGYREKEGEVVFGITDPQGADYTAENIYKHSPSVSGQMNMHDSIELNLETEDAALKVPGTYTATITLGVKSN